MIEHTSKSRRDFLAFMGRTTAAGLAVSTTAGLAACSGSEGSDQDSEAPAMPVAEPLPIQALEPSAVDDVVLTEGLEMYRIVSWQDVMTADGKTFGFNNDYLALLPHPEGDASKALLWVNHEYVHPLFVSGFEGPTSVAGLDDHGGRTREQVLKEVEEVGGCFLALSKDSEGRWQAIPDDPSNRKITARTPLRIVSPRELKAGDGNRAIGTYGNCSGGKSPWGTILTCEENYDDWVGQVDWTVDPPRVTQASLGQWEQFLDDMPSEHYGWVVEIDPKTGEGKKLTAMGRFFHEGAFVVELDDGRVVAYMGDDAHNQCIYKFISSKPGSLDEGDLYVADTEAGRWIRLNIADHEVLQAKYRDQTEVMLRCQEAAKEVGGSPQDRPEGIAVDPETKAIVVCLTRNKGNENYFGHILRIDEAGMDHEAMTFRASMLALGGEETGFACPDNIVFDRKGNLWFATDMSEKDMNRGRYESFKNNGLFYIPMSGPHSGRAIQVASAPRGAEFTGPCFTPDHRQLLLSVQHPGEDTRRLDELTSHWPDGGDSIPRPSVIAIRGEALDRLLA